MVFLSLVVVGWALQHKKMHSRSLTKVGRLDRSSLSGLPHQCIESVDPVVGQGSLLLSGIESSDPVVYEPELTTAQPLALLIMIGFGFVQLRLNKANRMAAEVDVVKQRLRVLEVAQLEGEQGLEESTQSQKVELEKQRDAMMEEISNLRCLISIGDTKINFRAPPTAEEIGERRRKDDMDVEGEGSGSREIVRVIVGAGVTVVLANLLAMLATDPVTSVAF